MAWPCRLVIDVSSSSISLPPSRSVASLAFYLLGAGLCCVLSCYSKISNLLLRWAVFSFCTVLRSCLWRCGKVVCSSTLLAVATAQNYFNNYEYFSKNKVWSLKQSHAVHVKATDDLMKTMAAFMSPAPRSSNIAQGLEGVRDICLEITATFYIRLWCGADKLSPPLQYITVWPESVKGKKHSKMPRGVTWHYTWLIALIFTRSQVRWCWKWQRFRNILWFQ